MLNLLLDSFSISRYVLLRKKLLILVIIDLIIPHRTNLRLFVLLSGQQPGELLFLSRLI